MHRHAERTSRHGAALLVRAIHVSVCGTHAFCQGAGTPSPFCHSLDLELSMQLLARETRHLSSRRIFRHDATRTPPTMSTLQPISAASPKGLSTIMISSSPRGTGAGAFAVHNIAKNVPFFSEPPFIRFPLIELGGSREEELLRAALSVLGEETKQVFGSLAGFSDSSKLNTNCCPLMPSTGFVGLFVHHSKLNHSCRPNTVVMVDGDEMTMVAQEDIKAGDEITISYLAPSTCIMLPRAKRIEHLAETRLSSGLEAWDCRCEICSESEQVIAESDKRRYQMKDAVTKLLGDQGGLMDFITLQVLSSKEHVPISLVLGEAGTLKVCQLTGQLGPDAHMEHRVAADMKQGLLSDFNGSLFQVGARVILFKLIKRPELNGRIGTVVTGFEARSKRIGVALDEGGDQVTSPSSAVLVLETNIMLLHE